jgi:hypothetical protein
MAVPLFDFAYLSCVARFENPRLRGMTNFFDASIPCHLNVAVSPILCSVQCPILSDQDEIVAGIAHVILNVRLFFANQLLPLRLWNRLLLIGQTFTHPVLLHGNMILPSSDNSFL